MYCNISIFQVENREFIRAIFVEQLDLLVASAQDGKICERNYAG